MISIDHSVRVIYGHTDMMGRVYYGRYFEYFESARAHFLRELGLSYGEIEESGVYIPVIESHCEYKHGATYDDILTIRTMICDVPKSRMKIEYDVLLDGDDKLVAMGHTIHTFINRQGSAVRPPKEFLSLLDSRLNSRE